MTAIAAATSRYRKVRGACYLTHGSDAYDARLTKRRRALSKALIAEGMDDMDDMDGMDATKPTRNTSYRLVIYTQVYENYGNRWKAKGGNEYHLPLGTADEVLNIGHKGLVALVNNHRHLIEKVGDDDILHSSDETIIGWFIYGNTQLTPDEQMESEMEWFGKEATKHYRETGWREGEL